MPRIGFQNFCIRNKILLYSECEITLKDLAIFECLDSYESEKLESMLSHTLEELTFVVGIVKVIDNEIVIMLKDRSCHSVIMRDIENAKNLKTFVNDLVFKKKSIISVSRKRNLLQASFMNNLTEE